MAEFGFDVQAEALAKRDLTSNVQALVQWTPEDFHQQYRQWYLDAAARGQIRTLNHMLKVLGTETEKGVFQWEYQNSAAEVFIVAKHDANAATTEIKAGGKLVLTNTTPGQEKLDPGEAAAGWPHTIAAKYFEQKAALEAAQRREVDRLQASLMDEFLTKA